MALVHDVSLGGLQLTVVPGTYKKRNRRTGGRAASFARLTIEQFLGQRQAFGDDRAELAGFGWDGLAVGPAFDGQGVEPFPNVSAHTDANIADVPDVANPRAYGAVAGTNAFIGIGRRIYKSVTLVNGTWANFTAAADLGAGFTISGLAYYQDDLLIMLSSGQDIRKFNTVSNALTVWRTGEKGQVGAGYAGQLIYAPRLANNQEELRLSGTKWNGNAVTHLRYLDSPILNMALFNGQVAIATRTSLYFMGGQPYPGEADDAAVTADTSRAPEWIGDPEPVMTHGQFAAGDDFTFLCSYRGRLYTWLQGRVAEFDGSNEAWARMGPEGVRCYGGCVAGDWLTVAIESRYGGHELWGFDGEGWWRWLDVASPAMVWPNPLAGAGNRELVVFRDGSTTYDLVRLNWRSSSVNTYAATSTWYSPLLDAGSPGTVKAWSEFGATFAAPENRGNAASGDTITLGLSYSIDGGASFIAVDAELTSTASSRTFTLRSELQGPVEARYVQLLVTWLSVSDWAPVLSSVWVEYEIPEVEPARRRIWELSVDCGDGVVRRDGQRDEQDGKTKAAALWDLWEGGSELVFTETDGGLWDPSHLEGRALWLKADALSGLLEGAAIGEWLDASGNGLAALQGSVMARPVYRTNVQNGLPVVRFDGVNDFLRVFDSLGIGAQPFSQFGVWKANGVLQALMFWDSSAGLLVTDFVNDVGIFSGTALFNFDAHAFGAWHLVCGIHNGASSAINVDGGAPVTGNAGATAPGGELAIGSGIDGGDRWLNGDIGELVITGTALSTVERQRLEGYAAHKWGLAAVLPGGHPYKTSAPLAGPLVKIESIEEKVGKTADAGRWGEATIALTLEEV